MRGGDDNDDGCGSGLEESTVDWEDKTRQDKTGVVVMAG
jgi:hypothetical protein